ncbi:MAG TPA: DUF1648 domain-containing protein [Candidatus Eremiobacteraceae bacterium]|nr:DUF1648 domain-containing protein [Candidatus Eremiobacteraceae bacterium]
MRPPQVAIVAMLALAAVQIAYFYPQLPSVMAGHFDAAGNPNSWQLKSAFFTIMGSVYLFFGVLYWVMPHLLQSMPPALINLPNKAYWLAPERREMTAHMVADQLAWFGAVQLGFVIFVCQVAINANLPGSTGVMSPAVWWVLGLFVAYAIVWLIRFTRMFRVAR